VIRFITPTDFPGMVVAEGPLYDKDRVLDVGFRMLHAMHEAVMVRSPGARCVSAVPELPSWKFFNHSIEMMMREVMEELGREFDIAGDACTLEAWPYHAGFSPLGSESLLRRESDLRTTNGNEPSSLDASPGLNVMRSIVDAHGVPAESLLRLIDSVLLRKKRRVESPPQPDTPINTALCEDDHAFFREVWASFIGEGVELVFGTMMIQAKFPHEVFGKGRGSVRIRVT
jgi:hypothetical protein